MGQSLDSTLEPTSLSITLLIINSIICWAITLFIFIGRIKQIKNSNESTIELLNTLQVSHLGMIIFYLLYIFFGIINAIGFFSVKPLMNCELWFILEILLFWQGKNFQYIFVLWRSYLPFQKTLMESNKFIITLYLLIHIFLITILSLLTLIFSKSFTIYKNDGFCIEEFVSQSMHLLSIYDLTISLFLIIYFVIKGKTITQLMYIAEVITKPNNDNIENENTNNKPRHEMFLNFQKTIILNVIICLSSIIFVLSNISFNLIDDYITNISIVINCFCVYLMFDENIIKYQRCCWYEIYLFMFVNVFQYIFVFLFFFF